MATQRGGRAGVGGASASSFRIWVGLRGSGMEIGLEVMTPKTDSGNA